MFPLLYLILTQVFCEDQCTFKSNLISITDDSSMDDIKDPYRPTFIRLTSPGCPYSPASQAQWEKAASLYPQVNFVTVDSWSNSKISSLFGASISTPVHGLFAANSAALIQDSVFGRSSTVEQSPQTFLDTILKYTKLYPISPPLVSLSPMIIDSFYTSVNNPIIVLYQSGCTDQVPFINDWSRLANEEIFSNGVNPRIGLLDCSIYPDECKRWSHPYLVKTPRAFICSNKTNNCEVLDSTNNVNSEKIDGYYANALAKSPRPTPSPVPIIDEKNEIPSTNDYTIIENEILKKKTVETIRTQYKESFIKPSSACENPDECQPQTLDSPSECPIINPSTDDHVSSLKIINFFRGLAGLSKDVTEDQTWSQQCYKTAHNMHKIGKVPSDHVIKNEYAVAQYCGEVENIQVGKDSLLSENSMSAFEASYKLIKDEGANNDGEVGHRRWLLHPNLNKIGIGFYPYKEENFGTYRMMKPAVTVVRIKKENSLGYVENSVPSDLKFISWPPEGPFPIDHLPTNWHISHPDFRNANLNDIKVFVRRDDDAELKVKQIYLPKSINSDSLVIKMSDEALKRCQIMRTITVSVFNDALKKVYRFSFELFDDSEITEVCLYSSDKSKCPQSVSQDNSFGPDQYQSTIFSQSTNPVKVHVVESIKTDSISFTASTKFLLLGNPIDGVVKIGSKTTLDVQDPSKTSYQISWSVQSKEIGKLETVFSAKSISVDITDDDETISIYDLSFYTGKQTKFSLSKAIYTGNDNDLYYTIIGENYDFRVMVSSTPAYQEYSLSSDSELTSPNIVQIHSIYDVVHQNTNKRVIKIYVSNLDGLTPINLSSFIPGRKRDYQFIIVSGNAYLSCDMNISKVANSITFSKFRDDQYTYTFEVYKAPFNVDDNRYVCPMDFVTINDATFTGDSSSTVIMPYLKGDQNAINSNDPSLFNDLYPEDNEDSSEINAIKNSGAKTRCIITTSGTHSSYKITYDEDKKRYNPFIFRPKQGSENKPVTISLYEPYFGKMPKESNSHSLYFENYQDLTLDMPTIVKYKEELRSCLGMYHFDNCGKVKFIGNDNSILPDGPVEIKNEVVLGNVDYGCTISTPSVYVQDSDSYDASTVQTKSLSVSPKTTPTVQKITVKESITVDSATLVLEKCSLNNDIELFIKKSESWWPSVSLQETPFKPKKINIDLGIKSSAFILENSEDYEIHSLITGIDSNTGITCDAIVSLLSVTNHGKFNLECSKDKKELVAVKGKENAPILTPADDINNGGGNENENPKKSNKKKLSGGAIAGIVIGVIAVIAIVVVVVILVLKKKGKVGQASQSEMNEKNDDKHNNDNSSDGI